MPSKQRRLWRLLDSSRRMANLMTLYYYQKEKLYTWGLQRKNL
uniref:Uncharacterized protein n=1 Tax=Arundo donax TaxID=35708 RepID=A0A0A9H700_ARUDO